MERNQLTISQLQDIAQKRGEDVKAKRKPNGITKIRFV